MNNINLGHASIGGPLGWRSLLEILPGSSMCRTLARGLTIF